METAIVLPLSHTLYYTSSPVLIIWQHNFIAPHLEFHSRFVLLKDSSHTVSHTLCLCRSHTHTHAPKPLPLFLAACAMFRPAVCAVVLNICSLGNHPSILQLWGRPYLLPVNMRRGSLGKQGISSDTKKALTRQPHCSSLSWEQSTS